MAIIILRPCRLPYSPKGGGDTSDYRGFMINPTYVIGGDIMSVFETLYLMISFGQFLIIVLTYMDTKK